MNYLEKVHLVTQRHLSDACETYADAAKELRAWQAVVLNARWHHFEELRSVFKDADCVDGYVVFNVRGNRYRLITVVHYARELPRRTQGHVYIRSFLTHAEYNKKKHWDPFAQKEEHPER